MGNYGSVIESDESIVFKFRRKSRMILITPSVEGSNYITHEVMQSNMYCFSRIR